MNLKFCSCRMCKAGRNRHGNDEMITHAKRAARHKVKSQLKKGDWDNIVTKISIPYTD